MHSRKSWTATLAVLLLFLLCAGTTVHAASVTRDYWQDLPARALPAGVAAPSAYRLLDLDVQGVKARIAQGETTLALPQPDGGFLEVSLEDSGTMPAELAARYPEIRSFRGQDSHGTRVRVDISPLGVNAMVFAKAGIWMVRPVRFGDSREYISFKRADIASQRDPFECDVHEFDAAQPYRPEQIETTTGTTMRTYRTAVAANHFYVQAIAGSNPPTVALGLAAVVATMNRVNEVYENDLSIHLSLVPNNDLVIYPVAEGDPYSNGTGALGQNTGNLNTVIGSANYDIGHVFTTGSGGVAGLGVVCVTSSKGRGTTGLSDPAELVSDVFYIDYVAHEMGHQFGGNHTFNNSCGGNRAGSAANEPGSGSTIMAYAGICSPNLQANSDAYFHARSLQEIGNFTTSGSGSSCSANAANHAAPVVAALTPYTIPASTPFVLTGAATSAAPNAALTYGWEQYDLGPATVNINVDPGTGPIIRSFTPTASPVRTVPRFSNLLAGTSNVGEILPTTNRTLTFRLTARDNTAGGGTSESRDVALTVNNAAGPFQVTSQPAGTIWNHAGGTGTATVTWNVANTDAPPVSCASVDIDVYSGGDFTSSAAMLASAVPNNGSAVVNVPNIDTTSARVRVRCSNNIFFAMSANNFSIVGNDVLFADGFETAGGPAAPSLIKVFGPSAVVIDTPSTLTITLVNTNANAATLTAPLTDTFPAGLVVAATPNAATTCSAGSVTAVAGSGSVALSTGAQIPAAGNCTVTVDVSAATPGTYSNTIAAGALQTSEGSNASPASAQLAVTIPQPPIVCSAPLNHVVNNTTDGTSINWISGAIINDDPQTGFDMNLYGTSLSMWWSFAPVISAGVAPSTSSSDYSVLGNNVVIGPASTWSSTNGAMTAWRAGASGFLGFRFDCSSIGGSTCYGYLRMTTTAPNGHPATLVNYCYDRTGAAITTPNG